MQNHNSSRTKQAKDAFLAISQYNLTHWQESLTQLKTKDCRLLLRFFTLVTSGSRGPGAHRLTCGLYAHLFFHHLCTPHESTEPGSISRKPRCNETLTGAQSHFTWWPINTARAVGRFGTWPAISYGTWRTGWWRTAVHKVIGNKWGFLQPETTWNST